METCSAAAAEVPGAAQQRTSPLLSRVKEQSASTALFWKMLNAIWCWVRGGNAPRRTESLSFHPHAKGSQIRLDELHCTAWRAATFHDGIVFTNRPVRPKESVALQLLMLEEGWHGGLRVGFTRLDPSAICPGSLPPYVCPDLVEKHPVWAAVLPDWGENSGDVVSFWVDRRGRLFWTSNGGEPRLLLWGVPTSSPLWAVVDIYGRAKAVRLLDPAVAWPSPSSSSSSSSSPSPSLSLSPLPWSPAGSGGLCSCHPAQKSEEECAICYQHTGDTRLLPCGHSHICSCCALRIFRDSGTCPMCRGLVQTLVRTLRAPGVTG
ncbi:E3 ubiquitin-protein ligase NEURL3 [Ornithorhynchus anatinus]|uniref:E3 ubiquitin-protein ligase NEURL3 n=1 Tax=Ornithorhynchus anatinus TaxID=9258 RepID=UPI0010A765FD|nr:E3 ubiquitin-protein ligase NEURL3 [Ornithorhynchus anatinus]